MSDFIRVTKINPCSICASPDWCGLTPDKRFAICMKVKSSRQTRNGGFLHALNSQIQIPVQREIKQSSLSHIEHRDGIYLKLLIDCLTLNDSHRNNLLMRGLSDEGVKRNLYRSLSVDRSIVDTLEHYGLRGVPGFYWSDVWKINIKGTGFFIPVRDAKLRIQALQYRTDSGDTKYVWLSSKDKYLGCTSGAPNHHARPHLIHETGECIITEGALKADIISCQIQTGVIALAGVSTFSKGFGSQLRTDYPELHTTYVCFDSDFKTNPNVRRQLFRLIAELRWSGLTVKAIVWDGAKGLDDLIKEVA